LPVVTVPYQLAAVLTSALLFWQEPLIGRLILPILGGAPAVWNTCLVFFQVFLLAGYLLAHGFSRLPPRLRAVAHLAVMGLGLLALPFRVSALSGPPASPLLWLLQTLFWTAGGPFLALAATTPLLQTWVHQTRDTGLDPYGLYAMSNLGSGLALAAFPLWLEPHLTLKEQTHAWLCLYLVEFILMAWVVVTALLRPVPPETTPVAGSLSWRSRWRYGALAAVPSGLLIAVTSHISLYVAAVPLLWILPLFLYLVSFVFAFARKPPLSLSFCDRALVLCLPLLVGSQLTHRASLIWIPAHLLVFFAFSLVCHRQLADERPPAGALTEYYLWISAGGALGGLSTSLLAPVVFSGLYEYPLLLTLAACLRPYRPGPGLDSYLSLLGGAVAVDLHLFRFLAGVPVRAVAIGFASLIPLGLAYVWGSGQLRYALAIGALLLSAELAVDPLREALHRNRSFFGVLSVVENHQLHRHELQHGVIVHGVQLQDSAGRLLPEPAGYYHIGSPVEELFKAAGRRHASMQVGLVGLGAGALAALARPTDSMDFYELDPAVIDVARNPRYFSYLSSTRARVRVFPGDARLSLVDQKKAYQLLILDAFNSDVIPVHLLTVEAMGVYLDNLSPGGVIGLHISNQYLDLPRLLTPLARHWGLIGRIRREVLTNSKSLQRSQFPSTWAVLARKPEDLSVLELPAGWMPLPPEKYLTPWTDDHSGVFPLLLPGF
jgi:hypothetical protein